MARRPPKETIPKDPRAPKPFYLNPLEVYFLMEAARATDFAAGLALMLFAGLKAEVLSSESNPPLSWNAVDRSQRTLSIPTTLNQRPVIHCIEHAPNNLWRWLEYTHRKSGPICEHSVATLHTFCETHVKRALSKNALRDSFIVHYLALKKDLTLTAKILGYHGRLSVLQRYYSDLVPIQQALDYFDTYPETPDIIE